MESILIRVPDISASELSALLAKELSLKTTGSADLVEPFMAWDFYRGIDGTPIMGRGKTFEARAFTFPAMNDLKVFSERRVSIRNAGYFGHVGAFLQWRRICGLTGWHATIPEDNACLGRDSVLGPSLSIPFTVVEPKDRRLGDCFLDGGGRPWWTYLGFKEMTAA